MAPGDVQRAPSPGPLPTPEKLTLDEISSQLQILRAKLPPEKNDQRNSIKEQIKAMMGPLREQLGTASPEMINNVQKELDALRGILSVTEQQEVTLPTVEEILEKWKANTVSFEKPAEQSRVVNTLEAMGVGRMLSGIGDIGGKIGKLFKELGDYLRPFFESITDNLKGFMPVEMIPFIGLFAEKNPETRKLFDNIKGVLPEGISLFENGKAKDAIASLNKLYRDIGRITGQQAAAYPMGDYILDLISNRFLKTESLPDNASGKKVLSLQDIVTAATEFNAKKEAEKKPAVPAVEPAKPVQAQPVTATPPVAL